jgi:hypothetical protein
MLCGRWVHFILTEMTVLRNQGQTTPAYRQDFKGKCSWVSPIAVLNVYPRCYLLCEKNIFPASGTATAAARLDRCMGTSKLSASEACIVFFVHEQPCMCRQRRIAPLEEHCTSFGLAHNPADWLLKGTMMDPTQTRSQVNSPFQELQTPFLVLRIAQGSLVILMIDE